MPSLFPRNIGGVAKIVEGVQPVAQVAAAAFGLVGASVDCQGIESVVARVAVGAVDAGTFTVDAKLQDSADNAAFADCAVNAQNPAVAITQLTAINTHASLEIDTTGLRRFVRLVHTVAFAGGGTKVGLVSQFLTAPLIGQVTQ